MERRASDARATAARGRSRLEPALAEATVEVVRPGDPSASRTSSMSCLPTARADARMHRTAGRRGAHRLRLEPAPDTRMRGAPRLARRHVRAGCRSQPVGRDRRTWSSAACPRRGASVAEADRAGEGDSPSVAIALAGSTAGAPPRRCSRDRPAAPVDAALPAIVVILQVASEGPLLDTFLDGEPLDEFAPRILDERVLHEGRLTNGAYDWPGVRTVTAVYQDLALLRELRAAHGERAAVRRPDPRPGLPRRRRPEAAGGRGLGRARRRSSAPTA